MGKFGAPSELEVIPVQGKSRNKLFEKVENPLNKKRPEEMHRVPYISDPSIVPRVQKVSYQLINIEYSLILCCLCHTTIPE